MLHVPSFSLFTTHTSKHLHRFPAGLFSRALAGTKIIVEKYLETIADGLNFICDSPIADEEVNCFLFVNNRLFFLPSEVVMPVTHLQLVLI